MLECARVELTGAEHAATRASIALGVGAGLGDHRGGLVAFGEVRDAVPHQPAVGRRGGLPALRRCIADCFVEIILLGHQFVDEIVHARLLAAAAYRYGQRCCVERRRMAG